MPKEKIRTVTFLTREQVDYLDKLGKDALFSDGIKLSRAEILMDMVKLLMCLNIDITKMDLSKKDLVGEIMKALSQKNDKGEYINIVPHINIKYNEAKNDQKMTH